jgi:hypothetical protein
MTRAYITAEIAKLEARLQADSTSAFAAGRRQRLAELQAQLATLPVEQAATPEDATLARWMEQQRCAERAQRATERRGY